jgi:hypothetical protein
MQIKINFIFLLYVFKKEKVQAEGEDAGKEKLSQTNSTQINSQNHDAN